MNIEQAAIEAAKLAGIKPNDMVRFIVDYKNGVDPVGPCATVMTFCEHFAKIIKADKT